MMNSSDLRYIVHELSLEALNERTLALLSRVIMEMCSRQRHKDTRPRASH